MTTENTVFALLGLGACAATVTTCFTAAYAIEALRSDDNWAGCSMDSFTWCWWVCVHSCMTLMPVALAIIHGIVGTSDSIAVMAPVQATLKAVATFVMSLGGAIATEVQFLDQCSTGSKGSTALQWYMWNNYGMAAWVLAMAILIYIDWRYSTSGELDGYAEAV
eukprot:g1880.t1